MSATLSTGARMPLLGLGTWKIATTDVGNIVKEAVRVGYRHIDCASDYENEPEVGAGIAAAIGECGVTREDLWVTSKLPNTQHRKEHVRACCEATLKDLGLGYLDLYLIHFPITFAWQEKRTNSTRDASGRLLFDKVPLSETWAAMESLVDAGLVRNIGVSNFTSQLILDLLSYARIPPVVNQVELHPYLSQQRLVDFCAGRGVHVTAFSPLGSPSYVPLGMVSADVTSLLDVDAVKAIAAKHGATPAQVLLQWGIARGTSIVPKTASPARLAENLASLSLKLDGEDIAAINALNANLRFNDPVKFWETDIYA